MKNIFKKLALVLALAMVVTLLPAKAVKAEDVTFNVSKGFILYVNGSTAVEKYAKDGRYVKSWGYDKDAYTAEYASSNEAIATVSSKGYVKAVGVGTATITVTLTDADGNIVATKSTKTWVKKNAASVELGKGTQTHITKGVDVEESFYLAVKRTDVDGNVTWKKALGNPVVTDYVKYESSDEKIFTVDKYGKITGVNAGTATLKLTMMELDGTKDTTKAVATLPSVEYTVKVTGGSIQEAKQLTSDTVALTISSAGAAAKLVNTGISAFAAYQVIANQDVKTNIKSVAIDADNASVVKVVLYNPLASGETYKFALTTTDGSEEVKVSLVGASTVIAKLVGNTVTGYVDSDVNSYAGIPVSYTFLNAEGVDITSAVEAATDGHSITFALATEGTKYYLSGNTVHFIEPASVDVTVTYTVYDSNGNVTTFTSDPKATVTASQTTTVYGAATYTVVASKPDSSAANYSSPVTSVVAADANSSYVAIKVAAKASGKDTTSYPDQVSNVTYSSTDSNVLAVGNDGTSCVIKGVKAGSASIIVKYGDVAVAVLPITVVANNTITGFGSYACDTWVGNGQSMVNGVNYTADSTGAGAAYFGFWGSFTPNSVGVDSSAVVTEVVTSAGCDSAVPAVIKDGDSTYQGVTVTGVDEGKTATVTLKFSYTYNGVTKVEVKTIRFRQAASTVASYKLNVGGQNVDGAFDTNVLTKDSNGNYTNGKNFGASFTVVSLDSTGFVINNNAISTISGASIQVAGTEVANASDNVWDLYTMDGTTVSAVKAAGTYNAVLYSVDGTTKKFLANATVTVKDSTPALTVTKIADTTTGDGSDAIKVVFNGAELAAGSYKIDSVSVGNSLVIKSVSYVLDNGMIQKTLTTTVNLTIRK